MRNSPSFSLQASNRAAKLVDSRAEDLRKICGRRAVHVVVSVSQTTSLVTGGAGFVGSHLVERLLDAGHRVLVLDDLSTGRRSNLPQHGSSCRLVVGSILDGALVRGLVRDGWDGQGVDHVFHLAAVVGLAEIDRRPGATRRVSVRGTQNVVRAIEDDDRVRSVLFTSSSEVYGEGPYGEADLVRPVPEDGRGRYAHSKWVAERIVARAARPSLRRVIARLFNTVGPRQRGDQGLVLARWRDQLATGEPLTVYGDGCQTRCFAPVDRVVDALLQLACEPMAGQAPGDAVVVNVGSDRPISIGELARRALRVAGRDGGAIRHAPFAAAFAGGQALVDRRHRRPDLTRLRSMTGSSLDVPIDDVLRLALVV